MNTKNTSRTSKLQLARRSKWVARLATSSAVLLALAAFADCYYQATAVCKAAGTYLYQDSGGTCPAKYYCHSEVDVTWWYPYIYNPPPNGYQPGDINSVTNDTITVTGVSVDQQTRVWNPILQSCQNDVFTPNYTTINLNCNEQVPAPRAYACH